jgi:transcriptional regulator with GAF, ATPase, and Fis domain
MNKGNVNHWIAIALLMSIISFLFYKNVLSDPPLNVENQILLLKNTASDLSIRQKRYAQNLNIFLFICAIYLIFYIMYIFFNLQKSKEDLSYSNTKLNDEINLRIKTEKALYQLVAIDKNSNNNDDDRILYLLNALCTALDVEYAYISKINSSGLNAEIPGLLDHGIFSSNITYTLSNTPCEEVIKNGRLVHNSGFSNYFPESNNNILSNVESYIGISLIDKNENVTGLIAIASDSPIANTSLAENILSITASRAIIELKHQIEKNKNSRHQHGLALIDDWITRLFTEGYDKDAFYKNICHAAQEITGAQLATFPAMNKDKKTYRFLAASGSQSEAIEKLTLNINDGSLCARTILHNKNLLINDVSSDPCAQIQLTKEFNIKSALLTPVTLKDKPYGAIAVFRTHIDFDETDEQLITQFSQSVQMAIINMQLVSDMRSEHAEEILSFKENIKSPTLKVIHNKS